MKSFQSILPSAFSLPESDFMYFIRLIIISRGGDSQCILWLILQARLNCILHCILNYSTYAVPEVDLLGSVSSFTFPIIHPGFSV